MRSTQSLFIPRRTSRLSPVQRVRLEKLGVVIEFASLNFDRDIPCDSMYVDGVVFLLTLLHPVPPTYLRIFGCNFDVLL